MALDWKKHVVNGVQTKNCGVKCVHPETSDANCVQQEKNAASTAFNRKNSGTNGIQ